MGSRSAGRNPRRMETALLMVVSGCNINFDADGNYVNTMDAGWIEQAVVAAARAQGLGTPRYIKPKRGAGYSDED